MNETIHPGKRLGSLQKASRVRRQRVRVVQGSVRERRHPRTEVPNATEETKMQSIDLGPYLRANTHDFGSCIAACLECVVACEMCSDACLDEDNPQELARCIRLDRDCAEVCAAAARAMARGGPQAMEICRVCADVCDACATECARHAMHHDHCRVCADACRKCAEWCRRMSGAMTTKGGMQRG